MSFGASKQFIGITDMLCEGPIQGLVDGKASVYINNIPFEKSTVVGTMNETVNGTFGAPTLSSSGTTVTVSNITITDDDIGKFIHVVVEEVSNITITVQPIGFPVNASFMSATGAGLSTDFNTVGTPSTYLRCVRPGGAELVADGSAYDGNTNTLLLHSNVNQLANQYQTMGSWTIQRIKTVKIVSRTNDTTIVVDSSFGTAGLYCGDQ